MDACMEKAVIVIIIGKGRSGPKVDFPINKNIMHVLVIRTMHMGHGNIVFPIEKRCQ